jgi:hypothetical protein
VATSIQYRQLASDCLDWSKETRDPNLRARLVEIAGQWVLTAAQMEAESALHEPPAEPDHMAATS